MRGDPQCRAIALLDKPSSRSFGMVPYATDDGCGAVTVRGLSGTSGHRGINTTRQEIETLVQYGHALRIDSEVPSDLITECSALWLGIEFTAQAAVLELLPEQLPSPSFSTAGGAYTIGPTSELYAHLDRWNRRAFLSYQSETILRDQRSIAELMRWCLPSSPETLATSWASADDKHRELRLQMQTFLHGLSLDEIQQRHELILRVPV
jgi:hypothetical protein